MTIIRQEAMNQIKEDTDYKLVTKQEAIDHITHYGWRDDILAVNNDNYDQWSLIFTDFNLTLLDDLIGGDWIYQTRNDYDRLINGKDVY